MPHEPQVYIVDDDDAVRKNLSWLLDSVDIPVLAFSSARDFMDAVSFDRPGCVLLDVRMPGMSGLELQTRLSDRTDDFPIIFISGHGDVNMVVQTMKRGAADFIEKPFNNQAVIDAVQRSIAGIADALDAREKRAQARHLLDQLTERERQVLDGIVDGWTNRQMAADLHLSEKTVEVHRAKMMDKMGAKSLVELVKRMAVLEEF